MPPRRRRKPANSEWRMANCCLRCRLATRHWLLAIRQLGRRQRLLDRGPEHLFEIVGRDRSDQLVGDMPITTHDEGLRHSVYAPFDRRPAVAVAAVGHEGIAVAAEKAARIVGLVLVVDAG